MSGGCRGFLSGLIWEIAASERLMEARRAMERMSLMIGMALDFCILPPFAFEDSLYVNYDDLFSCSILEKEWNVPGDSMVEKVRESSVPVGAS